MNLCAFGDQKTVGSSWQMHRLPEFHVGKCVLCAWEQIFFAKVLSAGLSTFVSSSRVRVKTSLQWHCFYYKRKEKSPTKWTTITVNFCLDLTKMYFITVRNALQTWFSGCSYIQRETHFPVELFVAPCGLYICMFYLLPTVIEYLKAVLLNLNIYKNPQNISLKLIPPSPPQEILIQYVWNGV